MNGVMIVLMIAELIFSIGLGLVIATIHSVLLKFMAAQNDLAMAAKGSRDRIKARVDKLETEQAKTKRSIELTDQDVKFMAKHVADTNAAMAELNKKTKGTASESEFLRMKNQVFINIPNQIARLDSLVTGKPYAARIEKRDGMIAMRYVPDDEIREKFEEKEAPDAQS